MFRIPPYLTTILADNRIIKINQILVFAQNLGADIIIYLLLNKSDEHATFMNYTNKNNFLIFDIRRLFVGQLYLLINFKINVIDYIIKYSN